MQAIMISIQPQWVEKILNGEKTIEIRKTKPKIKLPCKVYIYCTKGQELWGDGTGETWYGVDENEDMQLVHELNPTLARLNGKVVAEFTLNKVEEIRCCAVPYKNTNNLGYERFIDNGVYKLKNDDGLVFERNDNQISTMLKNEDFDKMQVKPKHIYNYLGGYGKFYNWFIDNLKIYDEPRNIKEFKKPCICPKMPYCPGCEVGYESISESEQEYYRAFGECETEWVCLNFMKKPPQSWCYIQDNEVLND